MKERAAINAKITNLRQQCWQLLRSLACTTQQAPTTPNIVGPNNAVTSCVRLHGTTTMLALVASVCMEPQQRWHLLRPFAWPFNESLCLVVFCN